MKSAAAGRALAKARFAPVQGELRRRHQGRWTTAKGLGEHDVIAETFAVVHLPRRRRAVRPEPYEPRLCQRNDAAATLCMVDRDAVRYQPNGWFPTRNISWARGCIVTLAKARFVRFRANCADRQGRWTTAKGLGDHVVLARDAGHPHLTAFDQPTERVEQIILVEDAGGSRLCSRSMST